MAVEVLRHPVAEEPQECGECRAFNIPTRAAYYAYMRGRPVQGECWRFAPSTDPKKRLYPCVWSDYEVCPYALGALKGEKTGPIV